MAYRLNNIAALVVDSNHNHMQLIKEVLRPLGVTRIAECTNAQDAIAYLENNVVDIIFTEWHMDGEMDGIGFVEWVRKNPASKNVFVPIIMVTAQSEEWKVKRARDAGITEFLVKPFSAKTMARRITVVIEYPRQFVRTDDFFGPDRRRHKVSNYTGPERRHDMLEKGEQQMPDSAIEELMKEL
ncbi:response regulator [uncultured Ferrovibrio sp.]|jgi:Response regulator containing a CheY-like receiver domain and a GGDEF domain|uniref:response regulator n=1 Tax=uncultured Ferrovibrio sp. TaxID=1576913 RepID=UPI0026309A68|nr:response regulator [uncultured Ferrovibrio sp.]